MYRENQYDEYTVYSAGEPKNEKDRYREGIYVGEIVHKGWCTVFSSEHRLPETGVTDEDEFVVLGVSPTN